MKGIPTLRIDEIEISRRGLLAGLGFGGALLLAAGCDAAVHDKGATKSGSGKPQAGGTLRAAIPDDLIPANLFTNSNSAITALIGLVYEGLIRYPNDRVIPQPRLATSWQLSSDGLSLTLNLRDDVKFHTGRAFTSKDVEFAIKTYADDKWNGQLKSTAQAISKVDTSNPHRAILHMDHPLSNIFDLLDTVIVVDSESIDDLANGKKYVGTGPFTFTSWTPNSQLVFAKNKNYWKPGRPYLDGVHISIVPDANSLTAQLKSSQVDFAEGISYRDAETLSKNSNFTKLRLVGAEQQIYVGANVAAKPLDDIRVRQAIAYGIDRDRIVSEVFRDSGYAVNLPWPKYSSAYDAAKNKRYAYDPDKAKALVKQIGGSLPTIPYTYGTNNPGYAATAQIVQSDLAAIGIKVELDPVDPAQFVKQLIGADFKGLWTTFHSWAHYTPSTLAVSAYPFNALHNASHYSSPQYTKDAQGSWMTPNGATDVAVADYSKVSDDLLDALFLIEIGVIQYEWMSSARLTGVSYTKRWELDLTNAYLS
jgi:peptide/nickel transport system substrate-binding protein